MFELSDVDWFIMLDGITDVCCAYGDYNPAFPWNYFLGIIVIFCSDFLWPSYSEYDLLTSC